MQAEVARLYCSLEETMALINVSGAINCLWGFKETFMDDANLAHVAETLELTRERTVDIITTDILNTMSAPGFMGTVYCASKIGAFVVTSTAKGTLHQCKISMDIGRAPLGV
jgi:hypothetical protein